MYHGKHMSFHVTLGNLRTFHLCGSLVVDIGLYFLLVSVTFSFYLFIYVLYLLPVVGSSGSDTNREGNIKGNEKNGKPKRLFSKSSPKTNKKPQKTKQKQT